MKRKRKKREVSLEYVNLLKVKDFLGQLTKEEIADAKDLGVFHWNSWAKKSGIDKLKNLPYVRK